MMFHGEKRNDRPVELGVLRVVIFWSALSFVSCKILQTSSCVLEMLILRLTGVDVHFHTRPEDFVETHRSLTTQGISFLMQTCEFLGHKCHPMTICR